MIGLTELDIQINTEAAKKYYKDLEETFINQKWQGPGDVCSVENNANNVYGWGLQTLNDPALPYHMYENPTETNHKIYKKTVNCIDWGSKLIDFFPTCYRSLLVVSPPGTVITPHTDPSTKFKIHIPIHTNKDHVWYLEDGEFYMEEGKVYALDVSYVHGTENKSKTNRVHAILEIQSTYKQEVLQMTGSI